MHPSIAIKAVATGIASVVKPNQIQQDDIEEPRAWDRPSTDLLIPLMFGISITR